jgi:hypothetical protein
MARSRSKADDPPCGPAARYRVMNPRCCLYGNLTPTDIFALSLFDSSAFAGHKGVMTPSLPE